MVIQVEMRGWNETRSSNLRNIGEPKMDTQQRHKEGYGLYKPKPFPSFFLFSSWLASRKMAAPLFFSHQLLTKVVHTSSRKCPMKLSTFTFFFSSQIANPK